MVSRAEGHARVDDQRDAAVRKLFPGWRDGEAITDIEGLEPLFPSPIPIGMLYHRMGKKEAHSRSERNKEGCDDIKLHENTADIGIC
jgi:hypothetical protein